MDFITIITDPRVITAIVGVSISYYLNKRIENLKKLLNIQEKVVQRKVEIYPKIIALIYRFRNLSRDFLAKNQDKLEIKNLNKIKSQLDEITEKLTNALYEYRLDLDDQDFEIIHRFKNRTIFYNQLFEDFIHFTNENQIEQMEGTKKDLISVYNEIEDGYKAIANQLSFSKLKKVL